MERWSQEQAILAYWVGTAWVGRQARKVVAQDPLVRRVAATTNQPCAANSSRPPQTPNPLPSRRRAWVFTGARCGLSTSRATCWATSRWAGGGQEWRTARLNDRLVHRGHICLTERRPHTHCPTPNLPLPRQDIGLDPNAPTTRLYATSAPQPIHNDGGWAGCRGGWRTHGCETT